MLSSRCRDCPQDRLAAVRQPSNVWVLTKKKTGKYRWTKADDLSSSSWCLSRTRSLFWLYRVALWPPKTGSRAFESWLSRVDAWRNASIVRTGGGYKQARVLSKSRASPAQRLVFNCYNQNLATNGILSIFCACFPLTACASSILCLVGLRQWLWRIPSSWSNRGSSELCGVRSHTK